MDISLHGESNTNVRKPNTVQYELPQLSSTPTQLKSNEKTNNSKEIGIEYFTENFTEKEANEINANEMEKLNYKINSGEKNEEKKVIDEIPEEIAYIV